MSEGNIQILQILFKWQFYRVIQNKGNPKQELSIFSLITINDSSFRTKIPPNLCLPSILIDNKTAVAQIQKNNVASITT
jgi:hypothetical protein